MCVSALLLAAGRSSRMGRSKQLIRLGDRPVIRHCIDALVAAGVPDIVVVVGEEKDRIAEALRGLPVAIAVNSSSGSEMAESVRVGLRSCDPRSSGVLMCLSDHPLVQAETFRILMRTHRDAPGKIVIPVYGGRRGHPSLFPAVSINEIYFKATMRDIVRGDPGGVLLLDVPDEGVILDMDTEADYLTIKSRYDALEKAQL